MKREFEILSNQNGFVKLFRFLKCKMKDLFDREERKRFKMYGLTVFAGMQGSGKTMSLVEQLERIRKKYPDVLICTNFGYVHENISLKSWDQILTLRNEAGIVFAIDEIQNEFDIYDTRNFSSRVLAVATQQRKQQIKIFGTSQHFSRVTKPLREQTFEVVECYTVGGWWTFQRCFNAKDYEDTLGRPEARRKLHRKWRRNFVQSKKIRELYDSYAVINKMIAAEKENKKC